MSPGKGPKRPLPTAVPSEDLQSRSIIGWRNVIVLAASHNPSIFTPDFLQAKRIVPKTWATKQALITRTAASVQYESGVRLNVDFNRLEIKFEEQAPVTANSEIYGICAKLIRILPHVPYTGFGFNWSIIVNQANAGSWMIDHFLKQSDWQWQGTDVASIDMKLQYRMDNATSSISLQPGKMQVPDEEEVSVIVANINLHFSISTIKDIDSALSKWSSYQSLVLSQLSFLLDR